MIISNFTEFYNLIKDKNLIIKPKLEDCIKNASRICNCHRKLKETKLEECNNIYIRYIKLNANNIRPILKNLTTDDNIVFNHSGNQHILTIKF